MACAAQVVQPPTVLACWPTRDGHERDFAFVLSLHWCKCRLIRDKLIAGDDIIRIEIINIVDSQSYPQSKQSTFVHLLLLNLKTSTG